MKKALYVVLVIAVFLVSAYVVCVLPKEVLGKRLEAIGIQMPEPLVNVVVDALFEARDQYRGRFNTYISRR
jgi:hypothetical protein